jgi:hypothetical protein
MAVGCKLHAEGSVAGPRFSTLGETEGLGSRTRKELHVLCYQHHTEMPIRSRSESPEGPIYVCEEPGCLIRYDSSQGYFLDTKDAETVELEVIPRVSCSNDEQHMYLAEVMPERRSFRLWKCPRCNLSRINNEESSGELEQKMGA